VLYNNVCVYNTYLRERNTY